MYVCISLDFGSIVEIFGEVPWERFLYIYIYRFIRLFFFFLVIPFYCFGFPFSWCLLGVRFSEVGKAGEGLWIFMLGRRGAKKGKGKKNSTAKLPDCKGGPSHIVSALSASTMHSKSLTHSFTRFRKNPPTHKIDIPDNVCTAITSHACSFFFLSEVCFHFNHQLGDMRLLERRGGEGWVIL